MNRSFNIVLLVGFLMTFSSCSMWKKTEGDVDLLNKTDAEIKYALDSLSNVSFDAFFTRISMKYKDSAQNVSFKTTVRLVNDSAVNARMSFAGIPIINSIVTPDSMIMTDKRNKCVVREELSFFKKRFGVDFNYENIEELVSGKPVGYDPNRTYYRVNDPKAFVFCTHKKREIRRNERKGQREIITYYTLTEDLTNLKSMQIISPDDTAMIDIQFIERQDVEGFMIPKTVEVTIYTPKQEINMQMQYKKPHIDRDEEIHFVIPEDYDRCK